MTARAWGRVAVWGGGLLLLCAVALLAGIAVWLGTQSGLEWLAGRAVVASGGQLSLENVRGSIYRRVDIGRLVLKSPEQHLELSKVAILWHPRALLGRELRVTRLGVDQLRIVPTGTPSAPPPAFPATLRLPLAMAIQEGRIGRIRWDNLTVAKNLRLRLHSRSAAHTLEVLGVDGFGVHAGGRVAVNTDAPFATNGKLDFSARVDGKPLAASLTLAGDLATLRLTAQLATKGVSATATARVRPFHASILQEASLAASDVNLAQWKSALPQTQLSIKLAATMPQPDRLAGTVVMTNALPGPLDMNRIPVKGATFGYAGSGTRWTLPNIALDIGRASRVTGSGTVDGATGQLNLALTKVRLDELHRTLQPLAVSGPIVIKSDADEQRVVANVFGGGARLDIEARHAQQVVTIERGTLRAKSARADFAGNIALAGRREYGFKVTFADLDPSLFVTAPRAYLNGTLAANGRLLPEWVANINLQIDKSRLRGLPLSAQAAFITATSRLFSGKAQAVYAGNRLEIDGSFGRPDDRLQCSVNAANLKAVDDTLGGSLTARATLSGTLKQPVIDFDLKAQQLRAGDVTTMLVDASGTIKAEARAPMKLSAHVTGLRMAAVVIEDLKLLATGSRRQHDVSLAWHGPQGQATLNASGTLSEDWRWDGDISSLESRGRVAIRLTAPARLSAGRGKLKIDGLQGSAFNGRFGPAELRVSEGRISTQGSFTGIALDALLALAPQTAVEARDAAIGGKWNFALDEALNGDAAVYLEKGDIALKTEPQLPFGLRQLQIDLNARHSRLQATLQARSTRMGTATATIQTQLEQRDNRWIVAANAPLAGKGALDMRSLRWLRALVPQVDQLDGQVKANLMLGGTVARPRLAARQARTRC